MKFGNTKESYGLIAIAIHWLVAFGFLGAYISVYYRHWFSEGGFSMTELNSNMIALYLHLSFGITIAVFVALRILWKLMNKTPNDVQGGGKFEHVSAHAMHWSLYAVMIIMPITGYMGTKLDTNFFFLFDIPKFNDTPLYSLIVERWLQTDWEHFEPIIDAIHKNTGAYISWLLIALHAGAALYHHVARKDIVLKRMAPWIK
ncbi:cytochrome b [Photobacterium sp. SDRW27]|uniref:cytochrome b n=1 Tax=Photobacterium obscurum TaxID=2829490 RepID=UPI002244E87F|nr:cytochrome b [Photobacterium obscurum]MCW8327848.1 cytochrome b [Photobacterium obscurum]